MPILPPQLLAKAQFTKDMTQTLNTYFDAYQMDGVVTVEVTTHGLWLPNNYTNTRQFLGLACREENLQPTYLSPTWKA